MLCTAANVPCVGSCLFMEMVSNRKNSNLVHSSYQMNCVLGTNKNNNRKKELTNETKIEDEEKKYYYLLFMRIK